MKVISAVGGIRDGAQVKIEVPMGPIGIPWSLTHQDYQANIQFKDRQISGPFRSWCHTHRFKEVTPSSSQLSDEIEYELPLPPFGEIFGGAFTRLKLERLFRFRHAITHNDLSVIERYKDKFDRPQKILVSGASGFVGSALTAFLSCAGHTVARLVRQKPKDELEIFWNPAEGILERESIEGFDYIIHLSGENVAQRWTPEVKRKILESRVFSTRLLGQKISELSKKPKAFICASAIGYYGERGDTLLDEESSKGDGFLADVCQQWEEAAAVPIKSGVRTVFGRVGVVLSPLGGALAKMILPFKLGLGGPMGKGAHYMSWIALDDIVHALYHCLTTELQGPVNLTAPQPTTNKELSTALGKALHRPSFLPTPLFPLRLVYGELVDEALMVSIRARPSQLLHSGFRFTFDTLESCLSHFL